MIVGITLDPKNVYVGHDKHYNLFWYSPEKNAWVYIDPRRFGEET